MYVQLLREGKVYNYLRNGPLSIRPFRHMTTRHYQEKHCKIYFLHELLFSAAKHIAAGLNTSCLQLCIIWFPRSKRKYTHATSICTTTNFIVSSLVEGKIISSFSCLSPFRFNFFKILLHFTLTTTPFYYFKNIASCSCPCQSSFTLCYRQITFTIITNEGVVFL